MERYYQEAETIKLNLILLEKSYSSLADIIQMDKEEAYSIFGITSDDYDYLINVNWYNLNLELIREAIAFLIERCTLETSGSIQNGIKKIWKQNLELLDKALYLQTNQGQIEQFFKRNEIIEIREFAQKTLSEEKYDKFQLILNNVIDRHVERQAIIMMCSKGSTISFEEMVEGILNWGKEWNRVHACSYILGAWRPWHNPINEDFTSYEKQLFFWLFLFEEELENPLKFDIYFPQQYRTYSEENLRKLSDWLQSLNRVDLIAVDATKCHVPDDEETIMRALNQGCGDAFGY